jgi:transglutaminase-like putative cysteine protease
MLRKAPALIFIFLFVINFFSFAQDQPVSWEEKYSDETFTYLLMERTVELKRDWSTQETIRMVAKIQKEGAKSLGEITIDYDKSFQEVKDIKAFITSPEGKKIKYKSIQDLAPYSGDPLYSDSRTKVITMPNVVPGSIIDWQATIITKKPIIKDAFCDSFDFSFDAPIKSLQYKLTIPKNTSIQIKNHNVNIKPQIKEEGDKIIYGWQKDFIDKFEPEEQMPPSDEFIEYITVSNIKRWEDIANWYGDLINKNLKLSAAMKGKVKELIKDRDKPIDRIQAIMKYIQDNFRYVSMSFGYHRYEPHPSDDVFNNKYGDCKDQVLVCMAMLKEAGIIAYPALFCDEDDGSPKDKLPMLGYFGHVILAIELEGKTYYTDILAKGYRFDEIPLGLQGGYVFVVNDKGGLFEQLPILDETENLTLKETKVTIREDGSALIEVISLWSKRLSIKLREDWKNMTEKQRKEFLESLDETYTSGGKMFERKWENLDSDYGQIKSFIKYERPRWAEVSGDFMSFGAGGYERDKDFLKEKRNYPIMFWSNSLSKETKIYLIPGSFEIVNCPKNINIQNEFTEFSRNYKIEGTKITEIEITRYKRARLPASDYNKIKEFYNQLAQLTNEKIIIKKKNR